MAVTVGIDLGPQELQVLGAAAGIGDKVEGIFAAAGDDGVVDYTASFFFQKAGQGRSVRGKLVERRGGDLHQQREGTGAAQLVLNPV